MYDATIKILLIIFRIIIFMLSSRPMLDSVMLRVSNFMNQFCTHLYKEIC